MIPHLQPPQPITSTHRLEHFSCGEPTLDLWLKQRALKNHLTGASRCLVLAIDMHVIGYYCLSAGAISHDISPKGMRHHMPDPLPVLLLGRLAIDQRYQNQGLGQALLRDAMLRAVHAGKDTRVFALLVHALSEPAKRFYISCGFIASPLTPMTLLMTLATVRTILSET